QERGRGAISGHLKAEGGAAWNDDVIAIAIGQQAEVGLKRAIPLVHKVDQVGIAIAEKVIHARRRFSDPDHHVFIEHERLATGDSISTRGQLSGFHMVMALHALVPNFTWEQLSGKWFDFFHPRWWI